MVTAATTEAVGREIIPYLVLLLLLAAAVPVQMVVLVLMVVLVAVAPVLAQRAALGILRVFLHHKAIMVVMVLLHLTLLNLVAAAAVRPPLVLMLPLRLLEMAATEQRPLFLGHL